MLLTAYSSDARVKAMQGAAVTASDISAAMVNEASRRYQAALAAGAGAYYPLRSHKYDLVVYIPQSPCGDV